MYDSIHHVYLFHYLLFLGGGDGFYSVYTTGLKEDVPTDHQSPTSLSADEPQSRVGTSSDVSWTSNTPDNISKDHRATAIIVGSVVGVCALAVLIGIAFFWWRSKRHNSQYNSDNVVARRGNSSTLLSPADSRVNGAYMTQYYHSNGSIDDYHDYSRRILHVSLHNILL